MAKKKSEKPAYGERPEPATCEPCEPEPMYIPVPDDKNKGKKTDGNNNAT